MSTETKQNSSIASKVKEETEKISEDAGGHLRRLRNEQGLTIKQVEETTRISASNLRAMEAHDYDSLPADIFTKGQVALYAAFLGLDGRHISTVFMNQRDAQRDGRRARRKLATPSLSAKKMAEPSHISSATLAAILLLIIIISFTAFCVYTSWNPFAFLSERTGRLPSSMISALQSEEAARQQGAVIMETERYGTGKTNSEKTGPLAGLTSTNNSRAAAMPPELLFPPYTLTLDFTKDTGVDLVRDGGETVHLEFRRGEAAEWTADNTLQVRFDQPDSAILRLNGQLRPFPKEKDGQFKFQVPGKLRDR